MSEKTKKSSLASAGIKLSILILASRLLGLIREMTKAAFLGTSAYADAFGIAFLIPNLFRRLFAENSISVAFIPTFRGYIEEGEENRAKTQEFVASCFTLVSFLTAAFVTAGIIFTPIIVKFFFNKDSVEILAETSLLTRIMFPYLFVISIAAFFQGVLNGMTITSIMTYTIYRFWCTIRIYTCTFQLDGNNCNLRSFSTHGKSCKSNVSRCNFRRMYSGSVSVAIRIKNRLESLPCKLEKSIYKSWNKESPYIDWTYNNRNGRLPVE